MVRVITDSACDLSAELRKKYDIAVLPLHIHLEEAEYEDGVNITPDEIYQWSDANKMTPKTSAFSIGEAVELFQRFEGDDLICFSISEEMSSSANVMRLAAQELEIEEHVYVINSKNLSSGIGFLAMEAAWLSKQGKSAEEIVKHVEKMIPKIRSSFVVDTLTYLQRGGRCSSVTAIAGSVLRLHPKIVVQDGTMSVAKKYRGKQKSVVMSYARDLEAELKCADSTRVFLTHSGCDAELVGQVRKYLEDLQIFGEILEVRAGSVISSHCGPGTLGVLFVEE